MDWNLVKSDFENDGSLRDIYFLNTNLEQCQGFITRRGVKPDLLTKIKKGAQIFKIPTPLHKISGHKVVLVNYFGKSCPR